MKTLMTLAVAAVLALCATGRGEAQVVNRPTLTREGARQIIATAIGEARRLNAPGGVIAVVDDGGHLIALERLDGTFAAGANIAIGKARTAALFKRSTRAFEDIIKNGRTAMVTLPDFTPLQGGIPIMAGEQVIGGIGVSGAASAPQDEEIAQAGAAVAKILKMGRAGMNGMRDVTFIDGKTVASGFAKGTVLDFHPPAAAGRVQKVRTEIERKDPGLDAIVPPSAVIEKLADGFLFTEGPVWVSRTATTEGYLLFSDPNANTIYRWSQDGQVSVFRTKSGYTGVDVGEYRQPGSNGLALDREGRLTINEHGNRRVTRLERTGALTVLADRYRGKRLNSPNDLVYRSDGALYFTDPPFGLPKVFDDPGKELAFSGVFCLIGGELKLVSTDLSGPNGLALSPDEKYLYVGNWDLARKVVMRYEVQPDGSLRNGVEFFDMTKAPGEAGLDGIKVDRRGNLYVSGPGGLWILSSDGKHLGTIKGPEDAANMAWGDDDGKSLYLTGQTGLYRLRLSVGG